MSRLQYKAYKLSIKETQSDGIIRGYASTFGNEDLGGDVVVKGAFKRSIKNNKSIPILDSHDPRKQIGWNLEAEEDSKGLLVEGQLNLDDPNARAKFSLVQKASEIGARMGLSIGYIPVKEEYNREKNVRYLKEVKLFEYSIVTFPMNTEAMITEAKGMDVLDYILDDALNRGYSVNDIQSALAMRLAEKNANHDSRSELLHSLESALKVFNN